MNKTIFFQVAIVLSGVLYFSGCEAKDETGGQVEEGIVTEEKTALSEIIPSPVMQPSTSVVAPSKVVQKEEGKEKETKQEEAPKKEAPKHWSDRVHFTEKIPQEQAYQKVLCDYLSTLKESDYEVELMPLRNESAFFREGEGHEQLRQYWALFSREGKEVSHVSGITIAADNYLWESIESSDGIMFRGGGRGTYSLPGVVAYPADMMWWTLWDYPGNPYYQHQGVLHRAITGAAIDLIMLDWLQEQGTHSHRNMHRADYTGGTLMWIGYVYANAKKHRLVEENILQALEAGIKRVVARMVKWGPTRINDNMDMKSVISLSYIAMASGDEELQVMCKKHALACLESVHPAGIIRDTGGVEASYNGIALYYLAWASLISPWPEVAELTGKISQFKSYHTFPEPDGDNYFGPSNFSTRTTTDMPNDQYAWAFREMALATKFPDARYLMFGGRKGRDEKSFLPSEEEMLKAIQIGIEKINAELVPNEERFQRWEPSWWPGVINYSFDYYTVHGGGFFEELEKMQAEDSEKTFAPFERRNHSFVKFFPDEEGEICYMAARYSEENEDKEEVGYGVLLEASPLAPESPSRTRLGFSGGTLAAFWTHKTGSVILGRMGGRGKWFAAENAVENMWSDWKKWPVHALSGVTKSGQVFSSARMSREHLEVEAVKEEGASRFRVSGVIGKNNPAVQSGAGAFQIPYVRDFIASSDGLTVKSSIEWTSGDLPEECYEILPLFIRDSRMQAEVPHQVTFMDRKNETYRPEAGVLYEGVRRVEIQRFEGKVVLEFLSKNGERVGLGMEQFEDQYMSRAVVWNLLVDLLKNDLQNNTLAVEYRIR